ncbi:hypothetical protein [Janthinobacterium fluminis]|uniref:Lipoprotein n=1 Tax=Janthinobacterium fluminis TaxID=2987524 RepID=A0ABT5JW95_9BURK|nr:hypothetical protein [Janthinobacterium fluminis]MDC8756445.1 hypothetical protein [Janthinobacterium fluminis]
MKNLVALSATLALLAGCGGGGSSASDTPGTSAPALAIYAGTWVEQCDGHQQFSLTMTLASNGTLSASAKTQYYDEVGCTGAIVATSLESQDNQISHTGTTNANVVLSPNGQATPIKFDNVSVTVAPFKRTISGPAVTAGVNHGVAQHCIAFKDGSGICVDDQGIQEGKVIKGGLYTRSNEFFLLIPATNSYVVDEYYTKK